MAAIFPSNMRMAATPSLYLSALIALKRKHFIGILLLLVMQSVSLGFSYMEASSHELSLSSLQPSSSELYEDLCIESLSFEVFDLAYKGYQKIKSEQKLRSSLISVVDFNLPSNEKRYYLIDIEKRKVLFTEYVTHGRNTGLLTADNFSNVMSSKKSSLGFFKTAETYFGKHGLSLRLDGLETGINHMARERAIVIHSADYACESFINQHGRLGRSFGCPALPKKNYKSILEQIKDGTLLFIYSSKSDYLQKSEIL